MARLILRHDDEVFYSSGTITTTGSSAVLAFGEGWTSGYLIAVGAGMTTDETNDITAQFFFDSAGLIPASTTSGGVAPYKVTFPQLTASVLSAIELLPGDMTGLITTGGLMPLPPYVQFTHTLAGTTKSMSYTIRRHLVGDMVTPKIFLT